MISQVGQHEPRLRHVWLEVTGRCNLKCSHCYADSGPAKGHGTMSSRDWLRVIDEAEDLGVSTIQFIGGEPTLHPDFIQLVRHAAATDRRVEVYSNMISVKEDHWRNFKELGVSLATSFYSFDRSVHDKFTGQIGSQSRTLANIEIAVARDIPIRVGIINDSGDDDDQGKTENLLIQAGVKSIARDRVRGVGRGATIQVEAQLEALCGNCASSSAAVDPDGNVFPCILARAVTGGNVRAASLADVMSSPAMQGRITELRDHFSRRPSLGAQRPPPPPCGPEVCGPDSCNPNSPPPKCNPLEFSKPYDPGRPPDERTREKIPIKEIKLPKVKVPRIRPEKPI